MLSPEYYHTIAEKSGESLYKEKGSKFYGMAFPVKTEKEIKAVLEEVKSQHYKARHWCYAWRLGAEGLRERAYDDGEPAHSAGKPILGQIQAFDLTDVLVVVVRYFGGVKLGVGGLVRAYKTAAYEALSHSRIIRVEIYRRYELSFDYAEMNMVQRIIKKMNVNILQVDMSARCRYVLEVPLHIDKEWVDALDKQHKIRVKPL